MKILNGLVLAASFTLATIGAAHAGLLISDQRYFPNQAHSFNATVLDAQASMDTPLISARSRAYQGGPKTGTGFAR